MCLIVRTECVSHVNVVKEKAVDSEMSVGDSHVVSLADFDFSPVVLNRLERRSSCDDSLRVEG